MQNYKKKFVRLALKAAIFTLQTLVFFKISGWRKKLAFVILSTFHYMMDEELSSHQS